MPTVWEGNKGRESAVFQGLRRRSCGKDPSSGRGSGEETLPKGYGRATHNGGKATVMSVHRVTLSSVLLSTVIHISDFYLDI